MILPDSVIDCSACESERLGWCGSCEICDRYEYDHTCRDAA